MAEGRENANVGRRAKLTKVKKQISSKQKALLMAYGIMNKKGIDPVVIDISELSSLADYFVIASGRTEIQVRAIAQEIERICHEEHIRIYHQEGVGNWTWVLLDLSDIIIHIFKESDRHYYDLESLWKKAPRVPVP